MNARTSKTLYRNEWLSLQETMDGYVYTHEEKSDGQGVAVLAFRPRPLRVVGRYENCPCHFDGMALTSLTGQLDQGETPVQTAVRELFEEAGITVGPDEMKSLGTVRPSKASDTVMHLFAVDIGDRDIGRAPGDGTKGEEGAYCKWVGHEEAIMSKSPVLATMVARLTMVMR